MEDVSRACQRKSRSGLRGLFMSHLDELAMFCTEILLMEAQILRPGGVGARKTMNGRDIDLRLVASLEAGPLESRFNQGLELGVGP
jgi:hypothetical protein